LYPGGDRLGVGGSDNDRVDLLGDEILENTDLLFYVIRLDWSEDGDVDTQFLACLLSGLLMGEPEGIGEIFSTTAI